MKLSFIYSTAMLFATASTASPTKIDCPQTIEVMESIVATDNSWSVAQDRGRRGYFLDSISIYSGHPREMANLVPDKTIRRNQERKFTWNLHSSEKEEYWVACSYSNSLSLLTKALPKSYKKCELTEKLLPSGKKLKIERFSCE